MPCRNLAMRHGATRGGAARVVRWLARCAALLACSGAAAATDWDLSLDGRVVSSNAQPPFMEGGLGTVRYGSDDQGLQLGRARFALTQSVGELWSVHLDASMYDDRDRSPVGVTEAYLLFRPYPRAGWRLRMRAGGFYPPVSLENRAAGWDSPYTLSYSAIDSWLAVEVRTLGVEGTLDWLGTRTGSPFDLGVTAGAFGWNEGAGAVLAGGGFSLTDRQTPLFGRVGQPGVPPLYGTEPFLQLDHHVGAYAGLEARYYDRLVLRVLRYDNRADPTQIDSVSQAIAWDTRFTGAGLRLEAEHGWTAIVQWMSGETTIEPLGMQMNWPFRADYALIAKRFGLRHSLSVRYDRFEVQATGDADGDGSEDGHAWTAAYIFAPDAHWRLALEWLRVVSSSYNRADLGGPPLLTETQLQLAVRYAIGSASR
jgi:hypothetical protein